MILLTDMMSCFEGTEIYFPLGVEHILDLEGYDHMLFVVALCALFLVKQWKEILVLVTAFTIGHSITLALSVLDIVRFPSDIIEFLIPTTIFLTALNNLLRGDKSEVQQVKRLNYLLALVFGFIHGMGFSNFLRGMLGESDCLTGPLLLFNLGIEAGQLVIVAVAMLVNGLIYLALVEGMKKPYRWWQILLSGAVALFSLYMMWETGKGL